MRRRDPMVLLVMLGVFLLLILSSGASPVDFTTQNLPSLPRPIAQEMVLITSAGQSTDTYIIKDIANKLMLHNYFMPQATTLDLEDINTIVFVVGYSHINEKLYNLDYEQELNRIQTLIEKGLKQGMTMITVYIGGDFRLDEQTMHLLEQVSLHSDYIIATHDGQGNKALLRISQEQGIPLTLVRKLTDITEPFASAFR